ncbi:hypothetical protein THOM_0869 [Trachipleistophora hominis]|uniref:Uncharacterized protein n=1 Tax=Trachipleistophora hominis TaxID=72359 RepID=L7JXI5_TRAHO|nr:hypothetical protein THOM_0869 [Trachipleistophora hominis]
MFNEWVVITNVVGQGLCYLLKWIGKNSVRGGFVEMIASGDATDKQLLSGLGFNVELCAERGSDSAVSNDFELNVISLGNLSYSEEMFGGQCSCRMRKAGIGVGDTRRELSTRSNVICREIEKISESQKQLVSIEDVDEQAVDVVILRPGIICFKRFLARNCGFLFIGALFSVWMVLTNEFP